MRNFLREIFLKRGGDRAKAGHWSIFVIFPHRRAWARKLRKDIESFLPGGSLKQLNEEMRNCAELCTDCSDRCIETMAHCLSLGGKHGEKEHITLLALCSDICATSARALFMGSELHEHTCRACAEICEACAEDCSQMEGVFMQECADICRACAESCRDMSGGKSRAA